MNHLKERAAELIARKEAGEVVNELEWELLARAVMREPEQPTWEEYCAAWRAGNAEWQAHVAQQVKA